MRNIEFKDDILTSVPAELHKYASASGIYFAITLPEDESLFNRNEYPSRIKIGMSHSIKVTPDDSDIKQQLDARGKKASTGTGYYYPAAQLFIPGKISQKIDDIVRKSVIPQIIRHLDPIYTGPFTNDDPNSSDSHELSFHVRKLYLLILFHLIYKKIYSVPYPEHFEEAYSHIISDSLILSSIERICKLSQTAASTETANATSISTNTYKETGFSDKSYYKNVFSVQSSYSDRIAIIASNQTDAIHISRLYLNNQVTVFNSSEFNIPNSEQINDLAITKYSGQFDIVLSNIPINGKKSLQIISDVVLRIVNRTSGKMSILVTDSLTSSMEILTIRQDDCGKDNVVYHHTGEKTSVSVFKQISPILHHHITSVTLDNLNAEFNQDVSRSFLNIRVDFSLDVPSFDFCAYGWKRKETRLSDCTLFGNTSTFKTIVRKLLTAFPDTISSHMIERSALSDYKDMLYLIRYPLFKSSPLKSKNRSACRKSLYGMKRYLLDAVISTLSPKVTHNYDEMNIPEEIEGSNRSRFIAFATSREAENYKSNTSLLIMKYISAMTAQQTRPKSHSIVPYLTAKQYADLEIASIAGFTPDEISHMQYVVSLCSSESALLNRMETGNKLIVPSQDNPTEDWASPKLY